MEYVNTFYPFQKNTKSISIVKKLSAFKFKLYV